MRLARSGLLLVSVALAVLVHPTIASAQEDWVQVLSGGNGLATRGQVDAMIAYRGHFYLATHEPAGSSTFARIFRSTPLDDTTWNDFTPPWTATPSVTDMAVFQDQLFVSTFKGEIWRLGLEDAWHLLSPGWTGTSIVYSMAVLKPAAGGFQLCAARGQLEMWCGSADADWHSVRVPASLAADPTIGSVKLRAFAHDLYLGVGDESATTRMCEVWALITFRPDDGPDTLTGFWFNVTSDCFGTGLQWVPAMASFSPLPDVWFFMGTAGHGDPATIVKTDGRGRIVAIDASPRDLYDYSGSPFAVAPVHNEVMAVVGDRLFVGNRTNSTFGAGDVIFTTDGATWQFSSRFGFGVTGNDAVTAFAANDGYLYAGVLNLLSGFQIWRRTPTLSELIPFFDDHVADMIAHATGMRKCVFPFDPACVADFAPLHESIDSIAAGFIRSKGDPQIVQQALGLLNQAHGELNTAQGLLNSANKEPSRGKAQQLRVEAMSHVDAAIDFARAAVKSAQSLESMIKEGSQE
jgi:hypothetical protein